MDLHYTTANSLFAPQLPGHQSHEKQTSPQAAHTSLATMFVLWSLAHTQGLA